VSSISDLQQWLERIGLGQYAGLLAEHGVDTATLPDLDRDDLEKLGIPLGHRKRLLKAAAAHRAALQSASERPASTPQAIVHRGAERRHLTVLFCDIVDSTALSVRLDPEDIREVCRAFGARCSEAIERYGGHVAKFMGDGVLAYFGFPAAHEDDPERAVNAALAIQASLSGLTFAAGEMLECRIGIATGIVVVGDLVGEGSAREFSLVGEVPNVAARLQQLAQPNQILIAPSTRRLLGQLFELADLGERHMKGFDRSVRAWQVLGPGSIANRFEAHRNVQLTPLVGREAELGLLKRHFRKASEGEGQLVLISGEPVIGKSRLVTALRDHLADEIHVPLMFHCSSYHASSAWHPVVRHLEDAAGITRDTPVAAKLDRLEAFVARYLREDSERAVPLLAALLSLPVAGRYPPPALTPHQQKNRTLSALVALLEARAKEQPAVLLFEDVHWIDPTSLELLERIRDSLPAWRMLAVVLLRPDFVLPWADRPHVTALTIGRLTRVEVGSMIGALSDDETLPRTIVDQIVAKTDGVPLFIEELTNTVIEARRATGPGSAPAGRADLAVPDTLHDSLMARLDQMAAAKTVAQVAATIGREFSLDLLESVVELAKREIAAAIDRLEAFGLLFRSGHRANRMYTFKHALVRDEAYISLLRGERRDLHVKIADALRTRFTDIAETSPELVAHHYTQARQHELAITYWIKAGQRANEKSAFAEAVTHLQAALELLAELPAGAQRNERELQLRQLLGGALIASKGFAAAETIQSFERALDLCRQFTDSPQIFAVLHGIVGFHVARGEFEQSRELAEDLLARARRQDGDTARLMGHRVLGMSLFLVGEFAAARDELLQALDLYDVTRHGPLAVVFLQDFKAAGLTYLALASILLGDVNGGLAHAHAAVEHAQQLGHPHSICYALTFLAGAQVLCGNPAAVGPVAERAIQLAGEYAFPQWLAGARMMQGWARVQRGEIEQGLADSRQSVDALEATGALVWVQFARYLLAQALGKAGRRDEALAIVERLLAEAAATSGRWYEADLHRLKGDLLLAGGAPAHAEACYERGIALAIRQGARHWQLRATNALGSLWRSQGRAMEMRRRLAPLCASFGDDVIGTDLQQARELLIGTE